ncbi:MAG: S-layer homology domain-containing protein [Patescibacteria group bacterium]
MKNSKWIIGIVLVVVIGAAVYLGNTATQKGAFQLPGNFDPRNIRPVASLYVTRGELMKMVVEQLMIPSGSVAGIQLVQNPVQHFSDVPPTNPNFIYIETAYDQGFVQGHQDGTFKPNYNLSRAEFAVLIQHAFGLNGTTVVNGTPYFVNNIPGWALDGVKTLYAVGAVQVDYRPNDILEKTFARDIIARMPRV